MEIQEKIAIIVAVTEIVKQNLVKMNWPTEIAQVIALVLALSMEVGEEVQRGGNDWFSAIWRGLLVGVGTTGTYAALKNIVNGKSKNGNVKR